MKAKITLANMFSCHGPLLAAYVRVSVRLIKLSNTCFPNCNYVICTYIQQDNVTDYQRKGLFPQVDQFGAGGWHWEMSCAPWPPC